jgi:putative hydrolase of the HAD superfamily
MAIKAVIFDCFGVLIMAGHTILYRDYPQFSADIRDLQFKSDLGQITRQEFNNAIAKLIGITSQQADDWYWGTNKVNQSMINWVRELKQSGKYKIGMLSNINRDWMDLSLPFFEKERLFDAMVLSGDVSLIKPDPAIFKLMANKLGVVPGECVMIDDVLANVDGAKQAGMQGIVYVSKIQSQTDLNNILRLNNA